MLRHHSCIFLEKNMDVLSAKVWLKVFLQGLPLGALSVVKVASNIASRNSCSEPYCSSLQGSLPPPQGCYGAVGICHFFFLLVTFNAVPPKPSSTHVTKLLFISLRNRWQDCDCYHHFCSWEPLGFPFHPQHSLKQGRWKGAPDSSPHPIALYSSSWVQQGLAFNYKVLFPHLFLIINPFFAWHMHPRWEHCKNAYVGPLGSCCWYHIAESSLAEMRPHLPSSHFPFSLLFHAASFVQKLGFLWAKLFPSHSCIQYCRVLGFSAWQWCHSLVLSTLTIQGLYV